MASLSIKTPTDWANAFLGALGLPDTQQNVTNIVGWENTEGGNWHNPDKYNPLDTTEPAPGAVSTNSVGVKSYTSWQEGLDATVQTITAGDYNYPGILNALSNSESWADFTKAVSASGWGGEGNPYILGFKTPPGTSNVAPNAALYESGASGTVAPSNPNNPNNTYNQGVTATQQSGSSADKPSTSISPNKLTGAAGIIQQLDEWYNPQSPGFIDSLTSLGGADVKYIAILIFTRTVSSLLMLGVVGIGITTMFRGSSSGGSGGPNVLEFVNNARVTNQKLGLQEKRLVAAEHKENRVQTRHSQKLFDNEMNRQSRERQAWIPRTHVKLSYSEQHRVNHNQPRRFF